MGPRPLPFLLLLVGAASAFAPVAAAAPPDAGPWDELVRTYRTSDGGFRYAALRSSAEHRARLDAYVRAVGEARDEGWSRDEALAFYVNAYNALTVKAVLDAWPLESVMRVEGFFDRRTHRVAGRARTLNQLENDVIRGARFAEPRIHFVVNCASAGCPPLPPRALTAANLEETLERSTRAFVRRTTRLRGGTLHVSQIFEWYAADFERFGGVRAFVVRQLEEPMASAARAAALAYVPYDWALNARP
ncbi:MAG: DUF547 domain-containing protein [Myxococcales bacterium]|nr:DUF547 domain-containing protein [Myxococcales bacterium]